MAILNRMLLLASSLAVYFGCLEVIANVCYLGQVPDPAKPGKHRWVLPVERGYRCSCSSLMPGGIGTTTIPQDSYFIDHPIFTDEQTKILKLLDCGVEFSIIGKPTEMSSTYRSRTSAKGVDGNRDTTTNGNCVHSGGPGSDAEYDPWWRVDLQEEHCISKVSILNRGWCCSTRTTHAVVRVGPSANFTNNPACGLPVTAEQAALPGGLIEIKCDPPLRARYVSVDIPVVTILNFCELTVEEFSLSKCSL